MEYKKKDIIFKEGEIAKCMYVIEQGSVKLYDNYETDRKEITTITEGNAFSITGVVCAVPHSATAVAAARKTIIKEVYPDEAAEFLAKKSTDLMHVFDVIEKSIERRVRDYETACEILDLLKNDPDKIQGDLLQTAREFEEMAGISAKTSPYPNFSKLKAMEENESVLEKRGYIPPALQNNPELANPRLTKLLSSGFCRKQEYGRNDTIMKAGSENYCMYEVLRGQAFVTRVNADGSRGRTMRKYPGETFGVISFIERRESCDYDAIAGPQGALLRAISVKGFLSYAQENPAVIGEYLHYKSVILQQIYEDTSDVAKQIADII